MTEKELRDHIIVKMLDYQDKRNVDINDFCSTEGITFYSGKQKERIFKSLYDYGYIEDLIMISIGGSFVITSDGIDYAKRLIRKINIENKFRKKYTNLFFNNGNNKIKYITSSLYAARENYIEIKDNNVEACFDVEYLAKCYVKLIDTACGHRDNNICLVGIFAPWGRGKSYFFKKIKEYINERKRADAMQYDIIEFNAWKYQETPAIWAYLFETLCNSRNRWFKLCYTLRRNRKSIASEIILCLSPTIITAIASLLINVDYVLWTITSSASSIGLFSNFISKHYNSAISLIKKYSKSISFINELGIQAEIEKEITSLLKFWIKRKKTNKKKVILYIDDIDRCSETKMTSIIDSLRTVLENEEIRKRLIIICSIDPEKIIKGIEYKYETIYNDKEERRSIAIDQMDKIFLTGMALSPLGNEQLFEFALKLTGADNNNNGQLSITTDNQYIKKDSSIFNNSKNENEECVELSDEHIYLELKNLINDNKEQLTPRKIRIIYYRILLANNIICNKENSMITETLIKNIFNLSVGNKIENSDKDDELSDVLDMVVPYRYNEENKYENNVKDKVKYNTVDVAIQS